MLVTTVQLAPSFNAMRLGILSGTPFWISKGTRSWIYRGFFSGNTFRDTSRNFFLVDTFENPPEVPDIPNRNFPEM